MDEARWSFLENEADPCTVVTRGMALVYANASARALVTPDWVGRRCWQVFPVVDGCAVRCPAVRAVAKGTEIFYCEESLACPGGGTVPLGVAVIPVPGAPGERPGAILLLRPKLPGTQQWFQTMLLDDARRLQRRALGQA